MAADLQNATRRRKLRPVAPPVSEPPPGRFDDDECGRVPPHDLDAEAAVLGTILVAGTVRPALADLSSDDFFSGAHRRVFVEITALQIAGAPIDVVTLAARLKDAGRLSEVGGIEALMELQSRVPVVSDTRLAAYVRIVRDHAVRRRALDQARTLVAELLGSDEDVGTIVGRARERMGADLTKAASVAILGGAALAAPLPDVDYLVREIGLAAGGGAPHLVAGFGFSGKTVAWQSAAVSLASGHPVWGVHSVASKRVLHVDLEQGDRLTRRRYQRLAVAMGVDLALLDDRLAVAVMPQLSLDLGGADGWRRLMAGRDILLLDSLRAATSGDDENSSDIRAAIDLLGHLSEETRCRVIIIHHARKPSQDDPGGRYAIRGSGAIYDAVDSAYLFTAGKGEPVRVEHVKARSHGELVEDFALAISDVEVKGDPRGGLRVQLHGAELVNQRRAEQTSAVRRQRVTHDVETVCRVLAAHPGIGTRELRVAAGIGADKLTEALLELGDRVEKKDEVSGRARVTRHYLRGGQP